MKKLMIAVIASTLMLAAQVNADGHKRGGDHNSSEHLEKMVKKLELTDEQTKKAKAIFNEAKGKQDALDEKYNIKAYRAEKKEIRSDKKSQISDILNDEQKAKFDKMCDHKKKGKKDKKGKKGQSDEGPGK